MKKNMATKLVKALRSGRYEQGKGRLVSNDDKFCCLGVACNISKTDLEWKVDSLGLNINSWTIGGEVNYLPASICVEFGFANGYGARADRASIIIDGTHYVNLADANDKGVPFSKIADYIEQEWEDF